MKSHDQRHRTMGKAPPPQSSSVSDPRATVSVASAVPVPVPMDNNISISISISTKQSLDSKNNIRSKVMEVVEQEQEHLPVPGVAPSTIPSSPLVAPTVVASRSRSRSRSRSTPTPATTATTRSRSQNQTPSDGLRRSGRERTSTAIVINGHTVLKQNNYVMKGMCYEYGDNNTVVAPETRKRKSTTTTTTADQQQRRNTKSPRVQTATTAHNTARQNHNHMIKRRVANKAGARLQHLAKHQDILKPFLDDSTRVKLATLPVPMSTSTSMPTNISEPNRELFCQPEAIQGDMRDYQLAGLNWMVKMHDKNLGMILGDEMGLGKTLQTIALFCHLKEKEAFSGPSLVICPLSVLYSWCNELKKWAPSLKILRFHSSCLKERDSQRHMFQQDAHSYDVVVTTYEMTTVPQLRYLWTRQYFNYLVLDEGHKIKDANSLLAKAARGIHRENALILTGTPLQNNLVELWSLLNFLYPDIFISSEPFAKAFDVTLNVVNKETLQNAKQILSLVMLRRLKEQVEKLMPKKIETKVLCPLSTTQVFWYKALLMKDIGTLAKSVGDRSSSERGSSEGKGKILSNLIMQLRKCCLHPYLFHGTEANPDETSVEDLIAASGKLAVLDKLLCSLYKKGHRTVLFSQFTSVLDILEDYCVLRGWSFCRFDGSTPRAKRNYVVNNFNEPGSDKFIFLMSTRSGGIGLNLQTADTCILYDSDWNPQPDLQAMARVHRIGQTKTVHVYRLITNGTVEERMVERQDKKLYMDRMVNSTGGAGVNDQDCDEGQITEHDILATLQFGCDAVFGQDAESKNCLPMDEDIEFITDRSRTQDFSGGNLKGGAASKMDDFEADKKLSETQKWAGIDFKKIRDDQKKKEKNGAIKLQSLGSISDAWKHVQAQKRERTNRVVMMDGISSGYGTKSVPVLASNIYDLENGESSVFSRELKNTNREAFGVLTRKQKKSGVDFGSQDFCQVCGDGGNLICCPRCPVSVHVHSHCSGVDSPKDFMNCSHHHCSQCSKTSNAAGGLLFACESCPAAYCEDCRPDGSRILGDSERFKELGFTTPRIVYIHCSKRCTRVAKAEFDWKEPSRDKIPCPPTLDVSHNFGTKVEEAMEATPYKTTTRLRPRQAKPVFPEPAAYPAVAPSLVPKVTAPIPAATHSFNPATMHASLYSSNQAAMRVSALNLPPVQSSAPTARVPPVASANQVYDLTETDEPIQAAGQTASAANQVIDLTDTAPPSEESFPPTAGLRVLS